MLHFVHAGHSSRAILAINHSGEATHTQELAMNQNQPINQVGAPQPEARTSPIMEETDEDFVMMAQSQEEQPCCYFNNVAYDDGNFVCSGSGELLRCEKGVWVMEGGCDPDNP
jgi:hypothetical protein